MEFLEHLFSSIMYIGFSTLALLLCYLISDDWRLLADKSISNVSKHTGMYDLYYVITYLRLTSEY